MASFWESASADLVRIKGRASKWQVVFFALTRRCYRPLVTLRVCQALSASSAWRWILPAAVLVHRVARHCAGLDLPWSTRIAPGFRIDHGWGLVLNAGAVIGSNVTMFHGVTLGQRDRVARDGTRTTGTPLVEDDVWIGPHAVIVGGITVGRGSRIAAGAFVTQDVPPASLVVGNPAQIVQSGVPPDVENPWSP
jgi:serine O-acetyltransferase